MSTAQRPAVVPRHVLAAIGNTPLVELRRIVPPDSARIVLKLEPANPTGSMKDRVAQAMVARAEADGRLAPGGTVVEYTGGTTGVSLAFICVRTSKSKKRRRLMPWQIRGWSGLRSGRAGC